MRLSLNNDVATLKNDGVQTRQAHVHRVAFQLFSVFPDADNTIPNLLPEGIRWISMDGTKFIFERPPTTISIAYRPGKPKSTVNRDEVHYFDLPVPWQTYIVDTKLPSVNIYFSNEQFTSLDDIVGVVPLTNIDTGGTACLGGKQVNGIVGFMSSKHDLRDTINYFINSFWENEFNEDIGIYYTSLPEEIRSQPQIIKSVLEHTRNHLFVDSLTVEQKANLTFADIETYEHAHPGIRAGAKEVLEVLSEIPIEQITQLTWAQIGKSDPTGKKVGRTLADSINFATSVNLNETLSEHDKFAQFLFQRFFEANKKIDGLPEDEEETPELEYDRNSFDNAETMLESFRSAHRRARLRNRRVNAVIPAGNTNTITLTRQNPINWNNIVDGETIVMNDPPTPTNQVVYNDGVWQANTTWQVLRVPDPPNEDNNTEEGTDTNG